MEISHGEGSTPAAVKCLISRALFIQTWEFRKTVLLKAIKITCAYVSTHIKPILGAAKQLSLGTSVRFLNFAVVVQYVFLGTEHLNARRNISALCT